ncbi:MAG: GNAT family N-acetyltransferase [Acidimicrobiia bacterium]
MSGNGLPKRPPTGYGPAAVPTATWISPRASIPKRPTRRNKSTDLTVVPATPGRWSDLESLFGPNGAYSNCWCTWWILTGKEFSEALPAERRSILEGLVANGEKPGLLAYRDRQPVGWCAVGPRLRYTRMMSARSSVYRPPDDPAGNWVINCFYIPRPHRGTGVATALLEAAVAFARQSGAKVIDAYPLLDDTHGAASLYVGTYSMFKDAGFVEISRVRERPLMRLALSGES